jgi:hypothetical protein
MDMGTSANKIGHSVQRVTKAMHYLYTLFSGLVEEATRRG